MHQRDLKARTVAARQALSDSQEIESCDPINSWLFTRTPINSEFVMDVSSTSMR
jgi:hypothetical protein